jgi:hypothetical protein
MVLLYKVTPVCHYRYYFIAKIFAGARTLQGYLPSQATKKEKVE